jgi:hypothetical protein
MRVHEFDNPQDIGPRSQNEGEFIDKKRFRGNSEYSSYEDTGQNIYRWEEREENSPPIEVMCAQLTIW